MPDDYESLAWDWKIRSNLKAIVELAWQMGAGLDGEHPHVGAIAAHVSQALEALNTHTTASRTQRVEASRNDSLGSRAAIITEPSDR